MLSALGNPFKCHEEVLYLQPLIPLKRFDFFPPTGGGSEGLGAFRFFFKQRHPVFNSELSSHSSIQRSNLESSYNTGLYHCALDSARLICLASQVKNMSEPRTIFSKELEVCFYNRVNNKEKHKITNSLSVARLRGSEGHWPHLFCFLPLPRFP